MGFRFKKADETIERLFAVAARKDALYFTDSELVAPTEAVTLLSDRSDPVPDEIWDDAARHYDEGALASLVLWIATTNVWNRLNVATKQLAGEGPNRTKRENGGKAGSVSLRCSCHLIKHQTKREHVGARGNAAISAEAKVSSCEAWQPVLRVFTTASQPISSKW